MPSWSALVHQTTYMTVPKSATLPWSLLEKLMGTSLNIAVRGGPGKKSSTSIGLSSRVANSISEKWYQS